jgi:alpha-galactosidase
MTRPVRPLPERRLRPPMGWNSWDCHGTTVTEDEVLANAVFLRDRMLAHGWDTVVVDIPWYEPTARAYGCNPDTPLVLDGHGRRLPAPNRFPSAADGAGFKPPADRVHGLGLRFGLHIMRGVPRRRRPAARRGHCLHLRRDSPTPAPSVPGTPTTTG